MSVARVANEETSSCRSRHGQFPRGETNCACWFAPSDAALRVTQDGVKSKVLVVDWESLQNRLAHLTEEIQRLESGGRAYAGIEHPSAKQKEVHENRILRLQEIQRELATLLKGRLA